MDARVKPGHDELDYNAQPAKKLRLRRAWRNRSPRYLSTSRYLL
jgi:hypothetical protein